MSQMDKKFTANKNTQESFGFSAKELDWLLRKLSEIKITMVEIDIASKVWNSLSNKHKEIVNARHKVKMDES